MRLRFMSRRTMSLALACVAALMLSACGGGGGGGSLRLSGTVSRAPSTQPGTGEAGADIYAYVWPNLSAAVAQTKADSDGRFTLVLPSQYSGKDIVLLTTPSGRLPARRYSCILADVNASGTTLADLDFGTTVAAELAAFEAITKGWDDIAGPAVETIAKEARRWDGIRDLDNGADGANFGAKFGDGVKPDSPVSQFVQQTTAVRLALAAIGDNSTGNVRKAKRMVQMMRDVMHALVDNGKAAEDSLANALAEQSDVMREGFKAPAALGTRVATVFEVLGIGKYFNYQTLLERAPGIYEWREGTSPKRLMVRVGDSPDGKSWKVISKIPDASQDWEMTITPDNPLPEFDIDKSAGRYVIAVRKPGQPAWKWDIILAATLDSQQRVTTITLSITATDPDLTAPLTYNGKVTGPASGTADNTTWARLSLSGSISSQFVTGQLDDLTVEWTATTEYPQDIKSIRVSNARLSTNFTKKMSLAITSASMEMWPADPRQSSRFSVPKRCLLDRATVEFSGHTFTLSNGELTFDREIRADGDVDILPRVMKGSARYSSPKVLFEGTINANWTSAKLPIRLNGSLIPLEEFPAGTIAFDGRIQPAVGLGGDAKGEVVFASGRTIRPSLEVKLTSLRYGDETMSGSVKALFAVGEGYADLDDPEIVINLTQTPSGLVMKASGEPRGLIGWIATDAAGTQKLANIGPADSELIGMPDLGSVLIIKYTDNTFETFGSLIMD